MLPNVLGLHWLEPGDELTHISVHRGEFVG
jgi:hypothetical protein